jgi:hypothetical protein
MLPRRRARSARNQGMEEASARRVHAEIFYLRRQVLVGDTEAQLRDALYLDITWGCEGSYCMITPVPHLCSN